METRRCPAITVDVVVIRDSKEILLIKRRNDPFKGMFAIPGGFVEYGESLKHAAVRELFEETQIQIRESDLCFSEVLGEPERDPRQHVVTIAYYTFVDSHTEAVASDDAEDCKWIPIANFHQANLAFDHETIIANILPFVSFIARLQDDNGNE